MGFKPSTACTYGSTQSVDLLLDTGQSIHLQLHRKPTPRREYLRLGGKKAEVDRKVLLVRL